ncbi:MAG TPA: type 4a pilus biogenesis protein PilO, partial [Anaeromyxobacter sp.]
MSAAPELASARTAPDAAARPPPAPARPSAAAIARRVAVRLGGALLARAGWTIGRAGRAGMVGVGLLLAAALFLVSTHLPVAAEVEALRADLTARSRARPDARSVAEPARAARALPARAEMPAILRQLFGAATQARLAVDTGKYEVDATKSDGLVRYRIAFPVTGPYPQIRAFLDATLSTMPAVALSEVALERRSIADANVEAQIRMTVYTAAAGTIRLPAAPRASDRVVAPAHAQALFAQHSWLVLPPAPVPPPPAPPPAPTAPPLPYA